MKPINIPLSTLLVFLILLNACQSPHKAPKPEENKTVTETILDLKGEEQKLKELIALETQLFNEGKIEAQLALTYNGPNLISIQRTPQGEWLTARGHANLLEGAKQFRTQNPDFILKNLERWDYVVSITPEMAYMTFQQKGTVGGQEVQTHEIRVFQKQDGQWKIALLSTIQ